MLVHPMPQMATQVGKLGVLGVIDLNCGWYCSKAMLGHWFMKLTGRRHDTIRLPKSTSHAYDPTIHDPHIWGTAIKEGSMPLSLNGWVSQLTYFGPAIAMGKLGAADWGSVEGRKLGVDHSILIVGADPASGEISYKDPLQGDTIRTKDFAHTNARIDETIYFLDAAGAMIVLGRIQAR